MPRSFAVDNKSFSMVATVVISLMVILLIALTLSTRLQAQGPALTTVSGTVYRADGTVASGTALISWPSFKSAEGDAVAAGQTIANIRATGPGAESLGSQASASPVWTFKPV